MTDTERAIRSRLWEISERVMSAIDSTDDIPGLLAGAVADLEQLLDDIHASEFSDGLGMLETATRTAWRSLSVIYIMAAREQRQKDGVRPC